jgi:putative ABC transport system permease protein
MGTLIQDFRYGLRVLVKNPGFTAIAVLTLAIGIGASTTVFSWIDGVLLRPLPGVEKADQLASFELTAPNGEYVMASYPDYIDYRDHLKQLSGLAVTQVTPLSVGEEDHAQQVWGELVSGNYFAVLGVKPVLGRAFLPDEYGDAPGAYPVAVISNRLWRTRFSSDPQILDKTIRVNRHELTVVGVAPPEFRGAVAGLAFDLWVPYMMHPQLQGVGEWMLRDRGTRQLVGIARLKPGVTLDEAGAEIAELSRYMSKANSEDRGISATVLPIWKSHFGAQSLLLEPLEILMVVGFVILLIVCANVANLLLVRFTARQREFSVRLALGAGRARLARQVLTESLVLASAGALAGVGLTMWMGKSLQYLLPPSHFPFALDIQVNSHMLAFTVLVCVIAALLSGVAPAVQVARGDLNDNLKEGGRSGTAGAKSHRLRGLLVVSELSLALVALVCAGLLVRSFDATRRINPEFDPNHVLLSRFFISTSGYDLDQRKQFCVRLRQKLETSPGVTDVAYSDVEPLGLLSSWWEDLSIEGYVPAPSENMKIFRSVVSPGYLHLMRIPLLDGRDFTEQDDLNTQPVMIVNQTFAQRYFAKGNPIGRKVHGWGQWFTVVGVAKDSKYNELTEAQLPFFYVPFRQIYRADMGLTFYVRTSSEARDAVGILQREVHEVDPSVTIVDAMPMAEHIGETLYVERTAASLLSLLGALGLLLAAVGLYSVMAYTVAQRTHEIGIRMALGARRGDVLRMVVRQGMVVSLTGVGIGLACAFVSTRLLSGFLYGVRPTDPLTFTGVALILTAVALLASYIPARRATKVDPMVALRYE